MVRPPDALVSWSGPVGRWRVVVTAWYDGEPRRIDVTTFRGAPTKVDSISWTDPFGPASATLSFPAISPMERRGGAGTQTWWLRQDADVDISFEITDPLIAESLRAAGQPVEMVWEGYIESVSLSVAEGGDSVSVECSGAMRALDRRVAQQIVFSRPHTYEWIISRHFSAAESMHPLRLGPPRIEWPRRWERFYEPDPSLPTYLVPANVVPGQPWTGLTAREFGRWDPVLSSAIQGLLSVMFTEDGQFTLMLDRGRSPVLRHRRRLSAPEDSTLLVDPVWPGVSLSLTEDGSQTAQAVYGESRSSISGTVYRGSRFTVDGNPTTFDPFALHSSVDPRSPMADPSVLRRELYINFSDGLTPAEAMEKARLHMRNNAAPGKVGTITLTGVDPQARHPDGRMVPFPGALLRAGMTVQLPGLDGSPEGSLFTISAAEYDVDSASATLTVDTRFRDYLTVREVMERGRDALRPWHMMTVGKYNLNIPDAMLPWSYEQGSGYIPRQSAEGFWDGADPWIRFPWTEHTRARPPKHATWGGSYIKVPAIQRDSEGYADALQQWNRPKVADKSNPYEVLLAQAGEIALLQIAAYDADGNIKRVPFHVSIWSSNNAHGEGTPRLFGDHSSRFIDHDGVVREAKYRDGAPYPFYMNAWEQVNTSGDATDRPQQMPAQDGLMIGYGNYWEKAGYWPGTGRSAISGVSSLDAPSDESYRATGMLVDETGFSFDMSQYENFILSANGTNTLLEHANCCVLIFCESETDTYFLGRLFRKEPGGG